MDPKDNEFQPVPDHLATDAPVPAAAAPQTVSSDPNLSGTEVPQTNVSPNENQSGFKETRNQAIPSSDAGILGGAILGGATGAVQGANMLKNAFTGGKSVDGLQAYANSQIGNKYNVPIDDLEKLVGHKIETNHEVQKAIERIHGSPAEASRREPIINKEGRVIGYNQIGGKAAVEPIDLSYYKTSPGKTVVKGINKAVTSPTASALATGYGLASGIQEQDPFLSGMDYTGAAMSAAAPVVRHFHPKGKVGAVLQGLGAALPAVSTIASHRQGGLVHLAEGGQPGDEDPSYNMQIRNAAAPYIGRPVANALFNENYTSNPNNNWATNNIAPTVGKYLAQVPGRAAQGLKDYVNYSKEGQYIPAMMGFLGAAGEVAPFLGKAGKLMGLAKNVALDKGLEAASPYIKEGYEVARPVINKGVNAVKGMLPQAESVLAGTTLAAHKEGGKVRHPDVQKAVGFAKKLRG